MSQEQTDLSEIAADVTKLALELGAQEASVSVSQSVSTELTQREQVLEKTQQSNSLGVHIELLVDDKFSSHSASDVRLDSLRPFLERAIQATHYLEVDENRKLPNFDEMGYFEGDLQVNDDCWNAHSPEARRQLLNNLEAKCHEVSQNSEQNVTVRSITNHVWDSKVRSHVHCSNGYSAGWDRTSFGMGGEITLVDENDRLPEAYDYRSVRYLSDLPSIDEVAQTLLKKAQARIGSSSIASDRYPILLENRVAAKLLGVLIGPMQGTSIYEKRSCLLDKLGQKIASSNLSIWDDPHVLRGLASCPFDNDGFATEKRMLVEDGVLQTYLLSLYNSRRLKTPKTVGSTSNIVIAPSDQSPQSLLNPLPKAISIEGFLGGNSNPISGDFSFGITGRYFENGQFVQGISEMNVSGNVFELFERFEIAADDVWTFSNYKVPSLLFSDIQCSGV